MALGERWRSCWRLGCCCGKGVEIMRRLDFEQSILEMVFEAGYEQLTPATVAFHLKIPIKTAETYLDELLRDSILEMEITDQGRVVYRLPEASRPTDATLERTRRYRATHGEGGLSLMPPAAAILHPPLPGRFTGPPQPTPQHPQHHPHAMAYHSAAGGWTEPQDPNDTWSTESTAAAYPLAPTKQPPAQAAITLYDERRSPGGSMLLSLLWPGLGQVYNGQPGKGVVLFFSSAFLWMVFMGWVVHVYALVDAGLVAHQINRRWGMRRAALPA